MISPRHLGQRFRKIELTYGRPSPPNEPRHRSSESASATFDTAVAAPLPDERRCRPRVSAQLTFATVRARVLLGRLGA